MPCETLYTLNALTLLLADEQADYAKVLGRADMVVADGVGMVWAIRRMTGRRVARVTGIDLIQDLCHVCREEGQGIYLLGGQPGVAQAAGQGLQAQHPGLKVLGSHNGFWSEAEESGLLQTINALRPALLLVGLGQPRQEQFLDRCRDQLEAGLSVGVGGSFDVLAGNLKRAPRWMQHAGLEWLFRVWQEPQRLRRIARLPWFVGMVLRMMWMPWASGSGGNPNSGNG